MADNPFSKFISWGYEQLDRKLAAGYLPGGAVPGCGTVGIEHGRDIPLGNGGGSRTWPGGATVDPAFFGTDTDQTWDYNPFADADDMPTALNGNGCNLQVMVAPHQKVINKAPRGYVIVETENAAGVPVKVAMLKPVAKSCGLWKPRARPVMTAADAKTIRRAASLQNKVDRLAKMSNSLCSKAPLRRTRSKR